MNTSAFPSETLSSTVASLRPLVQSALDHIAGSVLSGQAVRIHSICDSDSDHYLLIAEGWQGYRRIYRILTHIALSGENLHVYEDGTTEGVVERLQAEGVPKERIICEWVRMPIQEVVEYR